MDFDNCILNSYDTQLLINAGVINLENCAICRNDIMALDPLTRQYSEDSSTTTLLLSCGHAFHATCLIGWVAEHGVCRLCRNPVTYIKREDIPELQDETSSTISSQSDSVYLDANSKTLSADFSDNIVTVVSTNDVDDNYEYEYYTEPDPIDFF